MSRPGVTCPTSGINKYRCPCPTCHEFRSETARWNHRLASENLSVERGTSQHTASLRRRYKLRKNATKQQPKP